MEPLPRDPVSPRWPLGVRPGTGTGSRDTETIYGRDKGRLCWPRKASVSLPCRLVTVTSVRWCGRDGAAMGLVWGQGWAQSREERLTVSASWETPRPSHCPRPQWALYLGSPAALWGWGSRHGGRPTTWAQPLSEEGVCDRGHACETARSKWGISGSTLGPPESKPGDGCWGTRRRHRLLHRRQRSEPPTSLLPQPRRSPPGRWSLSTQAQRRRGSQSWPCCPRACGRAGGPALPSGEATDVALGVQRPASLSPFRLFPKLELCSSASLGAFSPTAGRSEG